MNWRMMIRSLTSARPMAATVTAMLAAGTPPFAAAWSIQRYIKVMAVRNEPCEEEAPAASARTTHLTT